LLLSFELFIFDVLFSLFWRNFRLLSFRRFEWGLSWFLLLLCWFFILFFWSFRWNIL